MKLDNCFIVEYTPEALEAVQNGNAIISTGGIRRKGDGKSGFLELSKPATMSVADLMCLFEKQEEKQLIDERLLHLESQLLISENGMNELKEYAWLNYAATKRTYSLTYAGFQQTLFGINCLERHISELERQLRERDTLNQMKKTHEYINYLKSDAGKLGSSKFDVINSSIADHLDEISAFVIYLLKNIENARGDVLSQIQMIFTLLRPFCYVFRKYAALYFFQNDKELMPGNYDEWVKTISAVYWSRRFSDQLFYYISLCTVIPYKDKVVLAKQSHSNTFELISNIEFERTFIERHSKEEYLALPQQIRSKAISGDFFICNQDPVFFIGYNETNIE